MPGVFPVDHSLPEEEIARRQIVLLRAGVFGEPNGRPDSSPEVQRIFFDIIARSARADAVNGRPMTIQWRFEDADPWYLRIANGSTAAEPGEAADPDLTLEASWQEWVRVTMQGGNPRQALLRRRVRPRGKVRDMLRLQKVFPPRPTRLA
jgi:hypothetical protein